MSRVLVVEDSQSQREMISKLLQENGFEVMTVEDGVEAVEAGNVPFGFRGVDNPPIQEEDKPVDRGAGLYKKLTGALAQLDELKDAADIDLL